MSKTGGSNQDAKKITQKPEWAYVCYVLDGVTSITAVSDIKNFNPKNLNDFNPSQKVQSLYRQEKGACDTDSNKLDYFEAMVLKLGITKESLQKELDQKRIPKPKIHFDDKNELNDENEKKDAAARNVIEEKVAKVNIKKLKKAVIQSKNAATAATLSALKARHRQQRRVSSESSSDEEVMVQKRELVKLEEKVKFLYDKQNEILLRISKLERSKRKREDSHGADLKKKKSDSKNKDVDEEIPVKKEYEENEPENMEEMINDGDVVETEKDDDDKEEKIEKKDEYKKRDDEEKKIEDNIKKAEYEKRDVDEITIEEYAKKDADEKTEKVAKHGKDEKKGKVDISKVRENDKIDKKKEEKFQTNENTKNVQSKNRNDGTSDEEQETLDAGLLKMIKDYRVPELTTLQEAKLKVITHDNDKWIKMLTGFVFSTDLISGCTYEGTTSHRNGKKYPALPEAGKAYILKRYEEKLKKAGTTDISVFAKAEKCVKQNVAAKCSGKKRQVKVSK